MPTYEYTCKQCGERLEVFQSFSDRPLRKHQGCGGELRKVFHARGIVFKGSGFYATDVRGGTNAGNGKSEEKTTSNGQKTEKKTENKAEPAKSTASKSSSDD